MIIWEYVGYGEAHILKYVCFSSFWGKVLVSQWDDMRILTNKHILKCECSPGN
jgi:hypothetical protein